MPWWTRLMLDAKRINAISEDVLKVMALPDPIGEMIEMRKCQTALSLGKKGCPWG
jgi:gamma-glutamyl phosphate reductase